MQMRTHLIGLLRSMGRLKGLNEPLWHQQQEACDSIQWLATVNLGLCDDWFTLGRTNSGHVKYTNRDLTIRLWNLSH